jgi:hypothetical protein
LLIACTAGATAQPARAPTENVTVTGTRSQEVLENFVESFAAPTRMTGKIARWEDGICPVTVGLRLAATRFVTQRVRDIAAKVGAPVNGQESCKPNIEIVFTTSPQPLLDNIRKNDEAFLGYADNSAQRDKLATVVRPIQAWYTTATKDLRGNTHVDTSKVAGIGTAVEVPCDLCTSGKMTLYYAASAGSVTGSRLGDGMRSDFYHIIIVADPQKLVEYEVGPLADYIAMLALTQLNSLDTCQQLPSIVNLLAAGCERKVDALTDNDIAYLRGLYKMSPGRTLRMQQDEIAYGMEKGLEGR